MQKVVCPFPDYMSDCLLKKCYVSLKALILCRWCMHSVYWLQSQRISAMRKAT